jgi:L-threonylcarbamoyladenylate synthase
MAKVSRSELIAGAIAGKVVSFPTDTVPALAVLPEFAGAIFALKNRPANKPLILMASTAEELWSYVTGTAADFIAWQKIANKYLPGAVTLVLPATDNVPFEVNSSDRTTVGIRIPDRAIAREILAKTGPLATTSANRSGEPPLEIMSEIADAFPEVLTLDCDNLELNGKIGSGMPSTVIKWTDGDWKILRQGTIVFS